MFYCSLNFEEGGDSDTSFFNMASNFKAGGWSTAQKSPTNEDASDVILRGSGWSVSGWQG